MLSGIYIYSQLGNLRFQPLNMSIQNFLNMSGISFYGNVVYNVYMHKKYKK